MVRIEAGRKAFSYQVGRRFAWCASEDPGLGIGTKELEDCFNDCEGFAGTRWSKNNEGWQTRILVHNALDSQHLQLVTPDELIVHPDRLDPHCIRTWQVGGQGEQNPVLGKDRIHRLMQPFYRNSIQLEPDVERLGSACLSERFMEAESDFCLTHDMHSALVPMSFRCTFGREFGRLQGHRVAFHPSRADHHVLKHDNLKHKVSEQAY